VPGDREPARFTDNFIRLLGLHGLTQHFTAQLLGVSEATMSSWMNGKSTPSLAKAIDIAALFQISTDRLMGAEFSELLAEELADPERYDKVEKRIKRGRTKLASV
jgi:transcriptional regulator with XRE-family HTH domain